MLEDIIEVGERTSEFPPVDGLGSFTGVLEGDTEVSTARAGRFGGLDGGCCVTNLELRGVVSIYK